MAFVSCTRPRVPCSMDEQGALQLKDLALPNTVQVDAKVEKVLKYTCSLC